MRRSMKSDHLPPTTLPNKHPRQAWGKLALNYAQRMGGSEKLTNSIRQGGETNLPSIIMIFRAQGACNSIRDHELPPEHQSFVDVRISLRFIGGDRTSNK